MKFLSTVVFASLLAFSGVAQAATWEGVYEGRLGKSAVIVELHADDDHTDFKGGGRTTSRYSYLPKVQDLNLMLEDEGAALSFAETVLQPYEFDEAKGADKKISGRWQLQVKDGKASGQWTSPDGSKKFPIALTKVANAAAGSLEEGVDALDEAYNGLWLKTLTFKDAGLFKSFGTIRLNKTKDSAFGIEYPLFSAFPDAAKMRALNDMLLGEHRKSVAQYRECKNGVPADFASDENQSPEFAYEVIYASPRVLTVQESGSVFCGGAHPNNYVSYITYDLVNERAIGGRYGLDLSPQGFGTVLELTAGEERIAFENFALARWQAAAKAAGEQGEDGCAMEGFLADQQPGEKEFSLAFDPRGLAVQRTDYPSAAANCLSQDFNPAIIPWADLKPWLKPGQSLLVDEVK